MATTGRGSTAESERGHRRHGLAGASAMSEVHKPLFNKGCFEFLGVFLGYISSC